MAPRYASFLLRCWILATSERRVRVAHIQSGEELRTNSLEAALAWIAAHDDAETAPTDQAEQSSPGPDDPASG